MYFIKGHTDDKNIIHKDIKMTFKGISKYENKQELIDKLMKDEEIMTE